MNARNLRIDLFALALGALALLTLAFVAAGNGAAVIMCALCLAALLVARFAGFTNRALVPVAFGLIVVLWMVWISSPAGSDETSALAHGAGGALIGWALAEYLRDRLVWPLWALAALTGVVGLTVLWELAEYLGDRALTTSLIPSARDSGLDIIFGTLGGIGALTIAALLPAESASH